MLLRYALVLVVVAITVSAAFAQAPMLIFASNNDNTFMRAHPLDDLVLVNVAGGGSVTIRDGEGRAYFTSTSVPALRFTVGGSLGKHTITVTDKKGKTTFETSFTVSAATNIDDRGRYKEFFDMLYAGMNNHDTGSVVWNGKPYRYFVPWGLDHCHTMKGLKYFLGYGAEFVDLQRGAQREDGMIWSFVQTQRNMDYFRTRDSLSGYTRRIGDKYFVRQPTENHPEYIFVNTLYQCWKASGDDAWMKRNLSAAARALDYAPNDAARWSDRFQLLKRVYTIDSWDFAVDDQYTPDLGLTNTMIIDPVRSKFGVFFGDNTGYIMACRALAEMYAHAGLKQEAEKYSSRASAVEARLNSLAWNGHFYTHFIDEDPTVKRDLGVDERSQLAQSNAYTLNRGLPHDKSKAIIESYLQLKGHLPVGSPGEWYAIYPPFERGFNLHDAKWQYMNGGVGGHVAGELARGAFENGYEKYAVDILDRLFALGKKYDHKIWFAYTGSIPPPPPAPKFRPLDLSRQANMDLSDTGSQAIPWMDAKVKGRGDDLHQLPAGEQTFANIRFNVIDPAKNSGRAVVAVSRRQKFPPSATIAVNDTASSVYFLHTATKPSSENVCGAVSLEYADGTHITRYMMMGKQLTYWWFPELKTDHSGIAWYGSNAWSRGVGLSWCAVDNPHPEKKIAKVVLHAPQDDGIYTVMAISLADRAHYVPPAATSFGGPDNWASATAMAALIEGLAGVKDAPLTQAFAQPRVAPRWLLTSSDTVTATIRYAASNRYVGYRYIHDKLQRKIYITLTGSGNTIDGHFLLPEGVQKPVAVTLDGKVAAFTTSQEEQSYYADVTLNLPAVHEVILSY